MYVDVLADVAKFGALCYRAWEVAALLNDVSYRKRAAAIAEQIAAEDGVANFIALLDKLLA